MDIFTVSPTHHQQVLKLGFTYLDSAPLHGNKQFAVGLMDYGAALRKKISPEEYRERYLTQLEERNNAEPMDWVKPDRQIVAVVCRCSTSEYCVHNELIGYLRQYAERHALHFGYHGNLSLLLDENRKQGKHLGFLKQQLDAKFKSL